MPSDLQVDNIKDGSATKTLATLSSSAVTLHSDVTFPTGHVLKVLGENYTGNMELTTSFVDVPNLSINITLSSQSNKIVVMANLATYHFSTATHVAGMLVKTVGGVSSLNYEVTDYYNPSGSGVSGNIGILYYDAPNTLSEINYKIQAKEESGSGFLNEDTSGTVNGVSSFTVWEIQG